MIYYIILYIGMYNNNIIFINILCNYLLTYKILPQSWYSAMHLNFQVLINNNNNIFVEFCYIQQTRYLNKNQFSCFILLITNLQ